MFESLHEMTHEQIANYIELIDRLCRGSIYSKQLIISRAKITGFTLKESKHPISSNWQELFHHRHPIQHMDIDGIYRT